MYGYKNAGPHNYPGVRRFENVGKWRGYLWSSRRQSADKAYVSKMAADWQSESMKPPSDKKQIERRPEYEI